MKTKKIVGSKGRIRYRHGKGAWRKADAEANIDGRGRRKPGKRGSRSQTSRFVNWMRGILGRMKKT